MINDGTVYYVFVTPVGSFFGGVEGDVQGDCVGYQRCCKCCGVSERLRHQYDLRFAKCTLELLAERESPLKY